MDACTLTPRLPKLLHGGDYNPEQWLDKPEVLAEDIRLMKRAEINCVTLGVFSWANLEPEEGVYNFDWLEEIINRLYENGIYTVLATPSGARPAWLTHKYPETARVERNLIRNHHGGRHNHCYTSPVYRKKTHDMDTALAKRFADNPAVILWHISNEISGQCYCPLCIEAFKEWLREKYHGSIDELNRAWYTDFWSQKLFSFDEAEPPLDNGMIIVHGLTLDWNRFCTEQTVDFMNAEIDALKSVNADIPCTTNMMMFHTVIDYNKFLPKLDLISWDSYPMWHMDCDGDETVIAISNAFNHDWMRSFMDKPFLLMENTPSTTNWCGVSRLKHPKLLKLTSLQAIAHGSNSVQYFQWRQSNGACEKFHSAVVSHNGTGDTIVFKSVAEVGEMLGKLSTEIYHTTVNAKVAIIYDVENKWAVEQSRGPRNDGLGYDDTAVKHYRTFWENGAAVDVIESVRDFSKYDILIAPMLYMLRKGVAERIEKFVKSGGTFVTTYFTGLVNGTDLCFNGTVPAEGLDKVLGIWREDTDALYDWQQNSVKIASGELSGEYEAKMLCDIIHTTTAEAIGTYGRDWYEGFPALTSNSYGDGKAYYLATNADESLLKRFYEKLLADCKIPKALNSPLPYGVTANVRENGDNKFVFLQNFTRNSVEVKLDDNADYTELLEDKSVSGAITLGTYGVAVLKLEK